MKFACHPEACHSQVTTAVQIPDVWRIHIFLTDPVASWAEHIYVSKVDPVGPVLVVCYAPAFADEPAFKVGFAKRDITPQGATPMWGYGDRHAMLSQGTADPLMAKAVVIEAGNERLAIVGMDIGRGPTTAMMEQIRKAVAEKAGVGHVMIAGSHTHHGPVIELTDREGFGKGKFDDAVAYAKRLPELLIEAIVEAKNNAVPARIGVAKKNLELNRNRHTKRTPKPTDPMLAVIRFDDAAGKPIAVIANFAAHPVTMDTMVLKFSADYPGALQNRVERIIEDQLRVHAGSVGRYEPQPRRAERHSSTARHWATTWLSWRSRSKPSRPRNLRFRPR